MRVIEPQKLSTKAVQDSGRNYSKLILLSLLVVGAVVGGWYFLSNKSSPAERAKNGSGSNNSAQVLAESPKKGTLRIFTPQQFRDLYNNFAYPNTERISDKTPITGNTEADNYIRAMAQERGYTLRSAPVANVFQEVAPGMTLQQKAAQPWLDMQAAAKKENIEIDLSAAYRSAADQTEIFTSRLSVAGINASRIPSGAYDKQISTVLQSTAVPGYSRHHTGYTIDITCVKTPALSFLATNCFEWLSRDNYKNAKKYGWIPSYPEGTGMQGPEPEAWEYVWVGTDTVTE